VREFLLQAVNHLSRNEDYIFTERLFIYVAPAAFPRSSCVGFYILIQQHLHLYIKTKNTPVRVF